jgi:hypothetical protein
MPTGGRRHLAAGHNLQKMSEKSADFDAVPVPSHRPSAMYLSRLKTMQRRHEAFELPRFAAAL